jgi:hypothetical protein
MAQSISTIDKLLKTQYLPVLVNTFQEDTELLGILLKKRSEARGDDVEIPVRLGRNSGIGFRGDGDTLPSAGNSTWQRLVVDPKAFYGRIQVSGLAIARTEGGKAKAFLKAFVDEAQHTMSHFKKRFNVALWGKETGYLGQVASTTTTTLVLDGPGITGNGAHPHFNAGTRYFPVAGDVIDCVDALGSAILRVGVNVTAVNHATNTLTIDQNPESGTAVEDGDFVAWASGKTTSDTWESDAFEGIPSAIDDGTMQVTYHGLSRDTYPLLKSNADKSASAQRDLTEALLQKLVHLVALNGGVNPQSGGYELRMSQGQYAAFVASQLPVKRFNTSDLKSGHTGLSFNGTIPVKADVDAPYESVYLWNPMYFKLCEVDGLGWLDTDGRILNRVANQDAYEARLRWFGELAAIDVHKMGVIRNLNEPDIVKPRS